MTEYRLQATDWPSTYEYHRDRERAPHLEQPWQAPRMHLAAEFVRSVNPRDVVDLGCGDGGMLSLLKDFPSWGFDFHPASAEGWAERGVTAEHRDVFNERPDDLRWAQLVVATEVLEHLADPHGAVSWIAQHTEYVVASSPVNELPGSECDSHIWSWDFEGYEKLFTDAGFEVLRHEVADWSQVLLARKATRSG